MKRFLLFFILLLFSMPALWAQTNNSTPFITKWSGTASIAYQVEGAVSYTLIDSTASPMVVASGNISTSSSTISITTGLNVNNTYYLHIVFNNNATVRRFYNTSTTNLTNLREVVSWGNTQWTSMQQAFFYATKLTSVPATPPDLSLVTNFSYMFSYNTTFNGDISNWDVNKGANFGGMFRDATTFNSDLSGWNVGNGTNFSQMFYNATSFNGDLSEWDVGNGTNFSQMFYNATSFNGDLSGWNVSSGMDFSNMFTYATAFNSDLSSWDVSNGTNFSNMFSYATAFTSDLSEWDVSNGTNFFFMFTGARAFTSDLSGWEVGNGTNFANMFYGATAFNSDLSNWDLSSVSSTVGMQNIFTGSGMDCYNLSNTIIGWANNPNTPSGQTGINLAGLSYNAAADAALNNILIPSVANGGKGWTVTAGTVVPDANCLSLSTPFITKWSGTTSIAYQVAGAVSYTLIDSTASPMVIASGNISTSYNTISITTGLNTNKTYYLHIIFDKNASNRRFYNSTSTTFLTNLREVVQWGDTRWTSMENAFYYATNLTTLSTTAPDVSLVWYFNGMFYQAIAFNGDLSSWDVSNGFDFTYMFANARAFTSDLSGWDVSNGTNFSNMFQNASAFNSDLSGWDVSNGTNFNGMFYGATAFNRNLNNWEVSNGTNFGFMFYGATAFTSDLSSWDVSNGTNFGSMFYRATAFTSDLSSWDVSNGTTFGGMFAGAIVFNSDLSNWDVSNGTIFASMFQGATAFNRDLSSWNVGNGTNFSQMFYGATAFNSDLSGWDVSNGANFSQMFYGATAFNSDLSGWDVSNGFDFTYMFANARAFTSDLSGWDVSNGTNFSGMFYGATAFNSDLSSWDVSNGTNFGSMFYGATAFNSDLIEWEVGYGANFNNMFNGARAFTSDLSNWDVSNGTNFSNMFNGATAFNSDLSDWDVSNGTGFTNMFYNAFAFNSDLSNWDLSSVSSTTGIRYIFFNSGMDCYNLSNTIIGWANNPNTPSGQTGINLTGLSYNAAADAALNNILIPSVANGGKGWAVTAGTVVSDAVCMPTALPLQLLSFTAVKRGVNAVDVQWVIIEDDEVQHYTIERSTPTTGWSSIGTVMPAGTAVSTATYQYTDMAPNVGTNLYRLKITDVHNKTTYSKVASVVFEEESAISIYPNPTTSFVTIASHVLGIKAMSLYNAQGQKIYEVEGTNANTQQLDLSAYASGVYLLHIMLEDGSIATQRIVVL